MRLLTLDRLHAAAHINRWRGWTKRPYSILEHQLIGAQVMTYLVFPTTAEIRAFMVHDMHETEVIGDVPTPDKKKYCNAVFDIDCQEFDNRLGVELGLASMWWESKPVKWMDRQMLIVENAVMSTRPDTTLPAPPTSIVTRETLVELNNTVHRLSLVDRWLHLWKAMGGCDVQ
jgi:hypothetical protein